MSARTGRLITTRSYGANVAGNPRGRVCRVIGRGTEASACCTRDRPPLKSDSGDRKSTRLNSSHVEISYAVFCLKKKKKPTKCLYHHKTKCKKDKHKTIQQIH